MAPLWIVIAVVLGLAVMTLFPLRSGEAFLQLAVGEEVLASGGMPEPGFLTYTENGGPAVSWGFGLLLAMLHEVAGMGALVVARSLLAVVLVAILLYHLRRRHELVAMPLLWIAYWSSMDTDRLELRPFLASMILLAATQLLARINRDDGFMHRPLRWLPWIGLPLFAAWSWLHPGFLLGLAALASEVVGAAIERRSSPLRRANAPRRLRSAGLFFGMAMIGSMANPYLLAAHIQPFSVWGSMADLGIEGWRPLWQTNMLPTFIGKAGVVALLMYQGRSRLALADWLCFAWALTAAFAAEANAFTFLVVTTPLLGPGGLRVRQMLFQSRRHRIETMLLPWVALSLVAGLTLWQWRFSPMSRPSLAVNGDVLPVGAVSFIGEAGLQGQIYHPPQFGGYLAWATGRKAFGTTQGTPEAYTQWRSGPEGQATIIESLGIEILLLDFTEAPPRAEGLPWTLLSFDNAAAVYVRERVAVQSLIASHGMGHVPSRLLSFKPAPIPPGTFPLLVEELRRNHQRHPEAWRPAAVLAWMLEMDSPQKDRQEACELWRIVARQMPLYPGIRGIIASCEE